MPDERLYTDDELIRRIWDIEQIRALMSRRSYYYTAGERERELDELWVQEPENREKASFGSNWGFYCGMGSVRRWYLDSQRREREQALAAAAADGYVDDRPENLGAGLFESRCVNTPLVVLSDDGRSARGRWYMTGQSTFCRPGRQAKAWWSVWTLGADFVREASGWRLLHLVEAQDFYCPVGGDFNAEPVFPAPDVNPEQERFGTADRSFLAHDNTYMLEDDWPPVPLGYETLGEQNSYGPEGHPGLNRRVKSIAWDTEIAARKAWGR